MVPADSRRISCPKGRSHRAGPAARVAEAVCAVCGSSLLCEGAAYSVWERPTGRDGGGTRFQADIAPDRALPQSGPSGASCGSCLCSVWALLALCGSGLSAAIAMPPNSRWASRPTGRSHLSPLSRVGPRLPPEAHLQAVRAGGLTARARVIQHAHQQGGGAVAAILKGHAIDSTGAIDALRNQPAVWA